jgi:hypothetical protein
VGVEEHAEGVQETATREERAEEKQYTKSKYIDFNSVIRMSSRSVHAVIDLRQRVATASKHDRRTGHLPQRARGAAVNIEHETNKYNNTQCRDML